MVKIRSGLLITLLLLLMAIAVPSVSGSAPAARSGSIPASAGSPSGGYITQGEPDTGQTGKDPGKTQVGSSAAGVKNGAVVNIRWLRWTSGVWLARTIGIGF